MTVPDIMPYLWEGLSELLRQNNINKAFKNQQTVVFSCVYLRP